MKKILKRILFGIMIIPLAPITMYVIGLIMFFVLPFIWIATGEFEYYYKYIIEDRILKALDWILPNVFEDDEPH